MQVKEKIGEGKNSSDLTKAECMQILYDWNVSFNDLSNADLDSLYFVANGHWAYYLPRKYYIENLNKYRLNNSIC